MALPGVDIAFFVRARLFAARRWHAVPRKGDEVMLGPVGAKKPYRVTRVVWGVEGPEPSPGEQSANVDLKEVK